MTSPRLIAIGALLLFGGPAFAQGTEAQRSACTPDVMRLCASHIPNVGAITSCLRSSGSRVSPACRSAMGGDAPTLAEARPVAPPVAARREAPARVALRRAAPERMAARPAFSRAAAARPVVAQRRPSRRLVAEARYDRRPIARRPDGRFAEHRPRRQFAGLGLSGSQMAQARYWMRTLGGTGLGSAVAGYLPPEISGISLDGIAGLLQ